MCLFYNSVAISAPNTFRIRKVDFYTGKTVCVCVRVCISNQSPIAEIPNIAFTINRFLDRTAVRRVLYTSSVGTLEETVGTQGLPLNFLRVTHLFTNYVN